MTKSEIQALIAENLADFSNIVPERHREVELAILDYIDRPLNKGYFGNINIGGTPTTQAVGGDCVSAVMTSPASGFSQVEVTVPNTMPDMNYYVRVFIQSDGDANTDTNVYAPTYTKINFDSFYINLKEPASVTQDLKIFFEVITY